MEELGWEIRNMPSYPWSNTNHDHQEPEKTFTFGSENTFLNPIQSLPKPGSTLSSSSDSASQYWHQEIDDSIVNSQCLQEDNNYPRRSKRSRSDLVRSTINFGQSREPETDSEVIAQMKEMIYRAAAFRPVSFVDDEVTEKPRRRNVRISSDPQTVAARKRRERVSERIRVLQKLVPGGDKMDTASMLDEAANYLKFLRSQVKALEQFGHKFDHVTCGTSNNAQSTNQSVTLGVPFPMQTLVLLPHQQIYPTPPHA